ncbi:MAG TPA: four helix bundle protein [Acidobacteriaceae bacterium]|nr:four helix bundle protein [Acidobacteriaceae bacterium]
MANTYRDLQVWQSSIDLAEAIYRLTSSFPSSEIYGLTSQMRRASVSVASNIAEGWGRRSRIEYRRFIQMALGSNDELQTQLVIAERLGFGNKRMLADSAGLSGRIGRMLVALHRVLHRPKSQP